MHLLNHPETYTVTLNGYIGDVTSTHVLKPRLRRAVLTQLRIFNEVLLTSTARVCYHWKRIDGLPGMGFSRQALTDAISAKYLAIVNVHSLMNCA